MASLIDVVTGKGILIPVIALLDLTGRLEEVLDEEDAEVIEKLRCGGPNGRILLATAAVRWPRIAALSAIGRAVGKGFLGFCEGPAVEATRGKADLCNVGSHVTASTVLVDLHVEDVMGIEGTSTSGRCI